MANLGVYRGRDQETFLALDVSGSGDLLLRPDQAINKTLKLTGTLSGARNIIFPGGAETEGLSWIVHNATAGAHALAVKTPAGASVTVAQGTVSETRSDGVDMLTVSAPADNLDVAVTGNADPVLEIAHSYSNSDFASSSGNHPDYSALVLNHTNLADTANISSLFDLIWTGVRSHVQYGSATVNARGTEHTVTATFDVQGSAGAQNELAGFMGWMRAKAASGTPADGVASLWFTDWSLHGNIGAQSALLNGITMFVNSHHADSPSRGRSAAAWFVTKPGQGGGAEDGHNVAETYPLNFMLGFMGYAGDVAQTTPRRGAETCIGIGEWGSGWGVVGDADLSWFGDGISIRNAELAALRIRDPHYDASDDPVGSAILFDNGARNWNWLVNAASSLVPLVGAIQLHEANSATANRIQWGTSAHAPAMYRPANGCLTARLPDASAGAKFHVHRTLLADPAFEVGGEDAASASLSAMVRNDLGKISLVVVGANNNFWTGATPGDVGVRWDADQLLAFIGGGDLIGSVTGAGAWSIGATGGSAGFLGATPVTRRTIGAAATDAATTQSLANLIRTALIDLGLAQAA
jgi:hypothetical protein